MSIRLGIATQLIVGRKRLDHYLKRVIHADANLATGHANDTRVARSKHLDSDSPPQSELVQSVNVDRLALDVANLGGLPGIKLVEGNEIDHVRKQRVRQLLRISLTIDYFKPFPDTIQEEMCKKSV